MTKITLILLVACAALTFAQSAKLSSASIMGTGADLARECSDAPQIKNSEGAAASGYAQGYCFGVLTTAAEILDSDGQIHFPEGASFGQIQKIVTSYLNSHPEEWQQQASFLVKKALKQAWGNQAR